MRGLTVPSLLEVVVEPPEFGDLEASGTGTTPGGRKGMGAQGGGDPELDGGLVTLCLSNAELCEWLMCLSLLGSRSLTLPKNIFKRNRLLFCDQCEIS